MLTKERQTKETWVRVKLAEDRLGQLDRQGQSGLGGQEAGLIQTGIGFFDHMLDLLSFHSGLYLEVEARGDLQVDFHHTVEDVGLVLGQLLRELYRAKVSYERYGSYLLPMDECLARVVLDLSGRPGLYFRADFSRDKVGAFDTELVKEFFNALAMQAKMTLHVDLLATGNCHHEIEAVFKAFGRALQLALVTREAGPPSSKGLIE